MRGGFSFKDDQLDEDHRLVDTDLLNQVLPSARVAEVMAHAFRVMAHESVVDESGIHHSRHAGAIQSAGCGRLGCMNRLGGATSPYLRQHAGNPVHWQEWGEEAMAEATRRDVPILLSVGYASCHW